MMNMNLAVDLGNNGSPSLFHTNDGFFYRSYQIRGITMYFRCINFKLGCPVRALIRINENFQSNGIHNHGPNFTLIAYNQERRMLLEESQRLDIARSVREVLNSHRIGNGLLAYDHLIARSMMRARMNVLPQIQNLAELLVILQDQNYICVSATSNEFLFRDSCRLPNGSTVILFMSQRCTAFLKIAPNVSIVHSLIGDYDLITIASLWDARVVCLGFVLMDGRGSAEFNAAFYLLRTHLNTWHFQEGISGQPDPLPSAFAYIFGVPLYPSLFDFIRDAKSFLVNDDLIQTPEGKYLLGLCLTLPLLPSDILPSGIHYIHSEYHRMQAANVPLFPFIQELLQMPHFSICGQKERTHYGLEHLRNCMNRRFSNFSGNIYAITQYMVWATERSLHKIDAIGGGQGPPGYSPPSSILADQQSQQLFKDLISPPLNLQLSVMNFMQAMVIKLYPFLQ